MKKKIKDLTISEAIKYCAGKSVDYCYEECPLQKICGHSFAERKILEDLESEVYVDE